MRSRPSPADWAPPADYDPAVSRVEGVELWAPRKVAEAEVGQATTQCPQCGAAAAFDVGAGALACRFCGFVAAPAGRVVGTDADRNEFTLEAMARAEQGWGVERKELACETCGAVLAVEAGSLSTTCPFCTSNHVNLQATVRTGLRPRYLIPFGVDGERLGTHLAKFLGEGWMYPGDLSRVAQADRFVGIYVPFWVFDARVDGSWRAEIGYTKTRTVTRDGKTETETYTEWHWESGSAVDHVHGLLVPGTTRISARLAERAERFDLGQLREYDPTLLAGWRAMSWDRALPDSWDLGRARMRERSRATNHADADSRTGNVRSFTMTADFEDERWRYVLLPLHVSAYRYGGKTWQVLVNGQTGEVVGQKPVAWPKIYAAITAAVLPGAFVGVCLGAPLTLAAGFGVVLMVVGLAMSAVGLWWGWGLWKRALDAEAA